MECRQGKKKKAGGKEVTEYRGRPQLKGGERRNPELGGKINGKSVGLKKKLCCGTKK